jgi:hypothetical protein
MSIAGVGLCKQEKAVGRFFTIKITMIDNDSHVAG